MNGDYSEEWEDLRRLRKQFLRTVFAGIAIMALIPVCNLVPGLGVVFAIVLMAAWVAIIGRIFWLQWQIVYWPCPRCGEPFHFKHGFLWRFSNPFASDCLHCGLPKWAAIDPDPIARRELDPFRTDQIFKLNDLQPRS